MEQAIDSMFRAYDIRGDTTAELTPAVMERIGKAFGTFVARETDNDAVVFGHDARVTSEEMADAFRRGVSSNGVDEVVELGLEPFGVVLFHGWQHGFETAYITASHLPKEWNGIKFYHPDGVGYMEDENNAIRELYDTGEFSSGNPQVRQADARQAYIDYVTYAEAGSGDVIMDCGNGVAGLTAPAVFRESGFSVDTLFEEPDGAFPNRESTVTEESVAAMIDRLDDYDIGVAYDGDSDRCGIALPGYGLLEAEETAYLVLHSILEDETGTIVANVECSRLIEDVASTFDCDVERVRVGHNFLFQAIAESDAVFGVEKAGHFAVPQLFPLDDGVGASAVFADAIDQLDDPSGILDDMPTYYRDRIPFQCPDERKFDVVQSLVDECEAEFDDTTTIDGVRVELPDGWVLIRASNTSAKIRLTVEAGSEESFERLKERFTGLIREHLPGDG